MVVSTISTTDGSGGTTLADLTLDADGDITLDAATGIIELKKDGTTPCNLELGAGGSLKIDSPSTVELEGTSITLDASVDIELNADGGNIDFKDNTASLARISSNGLSFENNTGAGVIFEGSTDNANQTTLSVIDPTATRTINLPDADGTVALQEKHIHIINMGFNNTGTGTYFLPLTGYPFESTSAASYTSQFTAPYDGKIIKVGPGWCTGAGNKTVAYKFYKNRQSTTQTGTTNTTASFTLTIPEVTPTDWTFSKGDVLGIQAQPITNDLASVGITVTLELDKTT